METSPLRAGVRVLFAALAAGVLTLLAAAPLSAALLLRIVPLFAGLPSDALKLLLGGLFTALGVACVAPAVTGLFGRVTEHPVLPIAAGTLLVPIAALLAMEGARGGAATFVADQALFLAGQVCGFIGAFAAAYGAGRAGRAAQQRADRTATEDRAREEEERRRMLDASVALAEKHEAARAERAAAEPKQ